MIKKVTITLLLLLLVLLSTSERLDLNSSEQLDTALTRSLSTFAVARGLNGLVSMVQGTEINISPVGLGATFTPGQLLDPVNDMVERFSWVMLMSSVSIGVQEAMLHLGKTTLFKLLFALVALLLLAQLWFKGLHLPWSLEKSLKVMLLLALLRFSVPLLVWLNEMVYEAVLEQEYTHAYAEVVMTSSEVNTMVTELQMKKATLEEERSFMDRFNVSQQYDDFKRELKASVDAFIIAFNEAMESMIRLITVFVLNAIIIPLLALWLFIYGTGYLMRQDLSTWIETK